MLSAGERIQEVENSKPNRLLLFIQSSSPSSSSSFWKKLFLFSEFGNKLVCLAWLVKLVLAEPKNLFLPRHTFYPLKGAWRKVKSEEESKKSVRERNFPSRYFLSSKHFTFFHAFLLSSAHFFLQNNGFLPQFFVLFGKLLLNFPAKNIYFLRSEWEKSMSRKKTSSWQQILISTFFSLKLLNNTLGHKLALFCIYTSKWHPLGIN